MLPLLLLSFLPASYSLFNNLFSGGASNCDCVPCAPPPLCATLLTCPPIERCPIATTAAPVQECCDTCACKKRQKRESMILSNATYVIDEEVCYANKPNRTKRDVLDDVVKVDAKCNSEELRDVIIQNIDRVTSVSKRRIQAEAESRLNGRFNVICARGDFSYITNTEMFCQQSVGDVTCYVFKQLSEVVRARLS